MKNAFEYEVELSPRGKLLKRRIVVGGIVVWGLVVMAAMAIGQVVIPAPFWDLLKR